MRLPCDGQPHLESETTHMPMTQQNRKIKVKTPLGEDVLLLKKVSGTESISGLFHFDLNMISEQRTSLAFDKVLGQPITVEIEADGGTRYINGIASRFSRGARGKDYTSYSLELVPKIWLLTRKRQSRIFQQISVPDILKQVLEGFDVASEIQGTFEKRDYCVQYRESDFDFISRLMEEEGIYYYFKHTADGHKLVLANTPQSHEAMPIAGSTPRKANENGTSARPRLLVTRASRDDLGEQPPGWGVLILSALDTGCGERSEAIEEPVECAVLPLVGATTLGEVGQDIGNEGSEVVARLDE